MAVCLKKERWRWVRKAVGLKREMVVCFEKMVVGLKKKKEGEEAVSLKRVWRMKDGAVCLKDGGRFEKRKMVVGFKKKRRR